MEISTLAPVLTPALAQEIAGDTSDIIGFNVLITDRDGAVIGSGDRSRVGTFHEASVEVIQNLQPATHSAAQARGLHGVRPGITLPIVLGDVAVGTVGITGSPAQVRRFGLVVKRQTEILLQESMLLRSRLLRERALDDLVRDIAHFDAEVVEPDLVAYRATELGYDITVPRVVAVVDVAAPAEAEAGIASPAPPPTDAAGVGEPTLRLALLRTMRATFAGQQDIVAAMSSDRFVVLHRAPLGRSADDPGDELRTLCGRVVEQIGRRHGLRAAAGIGTVASTVMELHDSYSDASIALHLGERLSGWASVSTIDDVRIHQLLAAMGQRARSRFVEAAATDLRTQNDWPALRQTVIAWCETGFNLVHAAAALHIHRNTLIYRLNKIAKLTGRQVRDHRAALTLYLACLADQLDDVH